ncbi:hypothetical protein EJV47_23450 [Hymenobacter gummosus]|uniref:Uncharacterized protein n=1 Tax=Hymenobacter gummosus TaxID=1776032 RepID=A0A3S0JAS7_9BACT|nr:hypothetical protein [Hymenobacter gummosus]RTQ45795.1 hypothetical protein EJV47_23450 [Hymenobacter gummosus]
MSPFRLLTLIPLWVACQSTSPTVIDSPDAVAAPQTQEAQEVRWAQEFFQQHYRYHEQPRYTGTLGVIGRKGELLVVYNLSDTLRIVDVDPTYYSLFTQGIIHPDQPDSPFYEVCNIEPHPIPTDSPQRRRFTLWHFSRWELHPEVYLFELTNLQATTTTDQKTFVAGATLTFMQRGWGVL